jgi:hypothetical protein
MVSGTIALNKLIQYSLAIEAVNEAGNWFIHYYDPDGVTQYKIQLDAASLEAKRDQMLQFLNQTVTLSGTIVETGKLVDVVTQAHTDKAWVLQ